MWLVLVTTGVLISPQPDQEGNKLQRPNCNFCKPLKKNKSESCPSNQVSAAAMTASDEKWRPFNCFFQSGWAKDLSAPVIQCRAQARVTRSVLLPQLPGLYCCLSYPVCIVALVTRSVLLPQLSGLYCCLSYPVCIVTLVTRSVLLPQLSGLYCSIGYPVCIVALVIRLYCLSYPSVLLSQLPGLYCCLSYPVYMVVLVTRSVLLSQLPVLYCCLSYPVCIVVLVTRSVLLPQLPGLYCLSYPARKLHLFCAVFCAFLWPLWLYQISPHYLINSTILGKTLLNTKCVF